MYNIGFNYITLKVIKSNILQNLVHLEFYNIKIHLHHYNISVVNKVHSYVFVEISTISTLYVLVFIFLNGTLHVLNSLPVSHNYIGISYWT